MTDRHTPPQGKPHTPPDWLPRAWKIRAALLAAIFALIGMLIYARMDLAGGTGKALVPLGWIAVTALAAGIDWLWLQSNHHRINSFGLTKGKSARNRPS